MEVSLEDKNWKEFTFEDVLNIDSSSSSIDRNKLSKKTGNTPYITRSEKDNGWDSFIGEQADKYKLDEGNVITIGLDTQTVFYQPTSFYTGQNIQVLRSEFLNKDVAQFLIPLIIRQMDKFNWGGNGATLTRLRRSKILLPTNSQGNPDYEFIEAYMRQKEQEKLDKYKEFVSTRLAELQDYKEVEPLEDKEWGEFVVEDLFSIKIGKNVDGNKVNKQGGKVAYVTRKETDNGIDGFINYEEKYLNKSFPVITIGNETAKPFVQQYPFFTGTKVNILNHKENISLECYKFIAQCLEMHKSKYSYSFTANSTRLRRQKIMLPINNQNQPDYKYMESYMKRLEYKKIKQYLGFKISVQTR